MCHKVTDKARSLGKAIFCPCCDSLVVHRGVGVIICQSDFLRVILLGILLTLLQKNIISGVGGYVRHRDAGVRFHSRQRHRVRGPDAWLRSITYRSLFPKSAEVVYANEAWELLTHILGCIPAYLYTLVLAVSIRLTLSLPRTMMSILLVQTNAQKK